MKDIRSREQGGVIIVSGNLRLVVLTLEQAVPLQYGGPAFGNNFIWTSSLKLIIAIPIFLMANSSRDVFVQELGEKHYKVS